MNYFRNLKSMEVEYKDYILLCKQLNVKEQPKNMFKHFKILQNELKHIDIKEEK